MNRKNKEMDFVEEVRSNEDNWVKFQINRLIKTLEKVKGERNIIHSLLMNNIEIALLLNSRTNRVLCWIQSIYKYVIHKSEYKTKWKDFNVPK